MKIRKDGYIAVHQTMDDFNRDAENLRNYFWIASACLIAIACLIWGSTALGLVPLCILFLLRRPWQYTISKAGIVDQKLEVTKRNWLLGSKSYQFNLSRIDFTYRTMPIKLIKNGMLNIPNTSNVMMVFYDEHLLFDLTPGEGNWTDTSIRRFANELKSHDVKQILEQYGTKDVLIY